MNRQHIIIGLLIIGIVLLLTLFRANDAVAPEEPVPSSSALDSTIETASSTYPSTPTETAPVTDVPAQPAPPVLIEDPAPPPEPKPISTGDCIVGGCSSQLCVDASLGDVASTCEWLEEYACYRSAICERQANGTCGWTVTQELERCIANARTPTLNIVPQ